MFRGDRLSCRVKNVLGFDMNGLVVLCQAGDDSAKFVCRGTALGPGLFVGQSTNSHAKGVE